MTLSPFYGFLALGLYFSSLLLLSFYRSRSATLSDYYIGSKNSTWWLITLGMIGDSVSGVTFLSVPGAVFAEQYSYFQIVMGYSLGYVLITWVLLPLYYKRNLISIYSYLGERFGIPAQKTGSFLFIASRTFGSAARLYISVTVLHQFLFSSLNFSPVFSFTLAMALIVLYTYKGGIKTLVWTEAYQSVILLVSVGILGAVLWSQVDHPWSVVSAPQIFFTDPSKPNFFLKQILGGMLITASMNGLDQNIMQLNLSCKRLWDAQKNMISLVFVMLFVNFIFLGLGALGKDFYGAHALSLPVREGGGVAYDQAISNLALRFLGTVPAFFFIVGLAAATFSSAGTILPAIASSIEIDLLPKHLKDKIPVRLIHALVAVLILFLIIGIYEVRAQSLISLVLRCSGYTYGPLIGLYGLGIFTQIKLHSRRVPAVCLVAIVMTACLDYFSTKLFNGYAIGVELIAINAILFLVLALTFGREKVRPSI